MRILLTILLPLVLPSLLFLAWLMSRRRAVADGRPPPHWTELPFRWMLLAAALGLVVGIIVLKIAQPPEDIGTRYVPPSMDESGRVVPGRFE